MLRLKWIKLIPPCNKENLKRFEMMEPLILIQYNNNSNSKKKERPNPALKKDMHVEYIPVDGNRWIATKPINRAGKATGKYSSCWNIQTIHKGEPKV